MNDWQLEVLWNGAVALAAIALIIAIVFMVGSSLR